MKKTTLLALVLSFVSLSALSTFGASQALAADECKHECKAIKHACKKAASKTCSGDLICILGEFEDCRDVYADCLEKCVQE
ncbi:MAG: hypothetical protein H7222_18260 [Methylotenera sp.]|nr:hypothetical protein [Oligoflexia bacterium]